MAHSTRREHDPGATAAQPGHAASLSRPGSDAAGDMYGMIIAGGAGTRLWPLSRAYHPKQLHSLDGESPTLLQDTFCRLERSVAAERIITVTGAAYSDKAYQQILERSPAYRRDNLLSEPRGRNSGPAILWGALHIARLSPEAVVVVVWSDHLIRNEEAFDRALATAGRVAARGELVAIGVRPTRPETGFGYIQSGSPAGEGVYEVERFIEKPDAETAQRFVEQEEFCWNAGMFAFKVSTLLAEYEALAPEMMAAFRRREPGQDTAWSDPERIRAVYEEVGEGSIDDLLLEKTDRLKILPCDLDWNDVGTWDMFYRNARKDPEGNVVVGNAITMDTRNSLVRADRRLITTVGVENLIVVDTEDALLICDLRRVQDVKKLVELLRSLGRPEVEHGVTHHRPWGSFTMLNEGPGYRIKLIEVLPGHKLSLQFHHHREEHWIVMEGAAEVVRGHDTRVVPAGGHVHIPQEQRHRIANPFDERLRILELQKGQHISEEDIVRLHDEYGRS